MQIREWKIEDAIELNQLECEIFSDPWSIYAIYDAIKCEIFHGINLIEDDKIIGYYGFYSIPPECHIANIAIKKEYRGRKLGEKLLVHLINFAESLGDYDITLEVREHNTIAQKLYKKYGFVEEGRRKKYYGDGEDAIIMWRRKNT